MKFLSKLLRSNLSLDSRLSELTDPVLLIKGIIASLSSSLIVIVSISSYSPECSVLLFFTASEKDPFS